MRFGQLETEKRNPDTQDIDKMSTSAMLAAIQREDEKVAAAVKEALPDIASAVDAIANALESGGRLFYVGAGTSGRLGVLDAAECPPTFNTAPHQVQAVIAGGMEAMFRAVEGAEDDPRLGENDLKERKIAAGDVVVGLAASGRTPYVAGALRYAINMGCRTVAVTCADESELSRIAEITVYLPVGPEVIAGSTRLKAGSAQKMVLNMFSTATMIKLGKTYGNLMVDVQASNFKLADRVRRIVQEATQAEESVVEEAVNLCHGSAKIAIVMLLGKLTAEEASGFINAGKGSVRQALLLAGTPSRSGRSDKTL